MPDTTTFDPVAMGLVPLYGNARLDQSTGSGENATWEQGQQTGWAKQLDDTNYVNYDLDGKETDRGTNSVGTIGKEFLRNAALMVGGGLALNSLVGVGGLGATTGSTVAAATGETFIPAAEAFKAAEFSQMAATNAAFDASVASGAVTIPSAIEAVAPALETVASTAAPIAEAVNTASTAQELFRAKELVDAATGLGSAAGGALTSTTSGIVNTISNLVRNSGLSGVAEWIKANPTASSLIFSAVGGAVNSMNQKDMNDSNNQSKLDQINLVQKLKLEDNARTSASVSGLRKPGLISQAPLTRLGGTPVFGSTGLINRG